MKTVEARKADRRQALQEVIEVVKHFEWVTLDFETTALDGEIVEWSVCDHDGDILGGGLVKPQGVMQESARAIHGISDAELSMAPSFALVADTLFGLIEDRDIITYGAKFDKERLITSVEASHNSIVGGAEETIRWVNSLRFHCAMDWFARIYGEWSDFHDDYKNQKLVTACQYFGIPLGKMHRAEDDAWVTGELVRRMAHLAVAEGVATQADLEKDIPEEKLQDLPF